MRVETNKQKIDQVLIPHHVNGQTMPQLNMRSQEREDHSVSVDSTGWCWERTPHPTGESEHKVNTRVPQTNDTLPGGHPQPQWLGQVSVRGQKRWAGEGHVQKWARSAQQLAVSPANQLWLQEALPSPSRKHALLSTPRSPERHARSSLRASPMPTRARHLRVLAHSLPSALGARGSRLQEQIVSACLSPCLLQR